MLLDAANAGYSCGLNSAIHMQSSIGLLFNADHMMGHFISCITLLQITFDTCIFIAVDTGVVFFL